MLRAFPRSVRVAAGTARNRLSSHSVCNGWNVQARWMGQSSGGSTRSSDNIVRSEYSAISIPTLPYADFMWQYIGDFGDRTALTCGVTGRSYTYEKVQSIARKFGSGLVKRGFTKGDVLGLVAPNIPEFPITFLGTICVGGIVSPLNPTYTAEEIARQFQDCGAKFVVTIPALAEKVKEAIACCPLVQETFVIGEAEGLTPLAKLTTDPGNVLPVPSSVNPAEDVVALLYSSGTTGLPKGVMITHQNLATNITQASSRDMIDYVTPEETMLAVLPMFHSFAMAFILGIGLRYGAHIVTLPKFDPQMFLRALQDYKPTILPLVPPMLNFLTFREDVNIEDLKQVRSIVCGGAPLSKALATSFKNRIHPSDVVFQEGYGMTELSPASHLCPKTSGRIGTCGVLLPNTEAKVVDLNTGKSLGAETEGELYVRGPQVMKGYHNNTKATKDTIDEDGWLHTGDIAVYDDDGYFQVVDRLKELIKVKGLQVAPSELEDILLSHPNVKDAAVIGIPDRMAGELPKAYIVPSGEVTKDTINDFVNRKVAPHKQLKGGVEFVKSIPKTQSGKILRRELKQQNPDTKT